MSANAADGKAAQTATDKSRAKTTRMPSWLEAASEVSALPDNVAL